MFCGLAVADVEEATDDVLSGRNKLRRHEYVM
jgi:hypothetical protein